MTQSPDTSPILDSKGERRIQEVVGVLLYHVRALNSPDLASLSNIGTEQNQPTANTAAATTKLLNYCARINITNNKYSISIYLFYIDILRHTNTSNIKYSISKYHLYIDISCSIQHDCNQTLYTNIIYIY